RRSIRCKQSILKFCLLIAAVPVTLFLLYCPRLIPNSFPLTSVTATMANVGEDSLSLDSDDCESLDVWMASHEVDQKALGAFAASTGLEDPFLSAMLYKVLG